MKHIITIMVNEEPIEATIQLGETADGVITTEQYEQHISEPYKAFTE